MAYAEHLPMTKRSVYTPFRVEAWSIDEQKGINGDTKWQVQIYFGDEVECDLGCGRFQTKTLYSAPSFKAGDDIKDLVVIYETISLNPFREGDRPFRKISSNPFRYIQAYRRAEVTFVDQIVDLEGVEPGPPAFITRYNWRRLINRVEFGEQALGQVELDFPGIKTLFSELELHHLRAMKFLADNPDFFATSIRFRPQDSRRYVIPEKAPAYHEHSNCSLLSADYNNWLIPRTILTEGRVAQYRRWFSSNEKLRLENPIKFVEATAQQFELPETEQLQVLEEVNFPNSGYELAAVEDLLEKITLLFSEAQRLRAISDEARLANCKRFLLAVLEEYYQAKISSDLTFGCFWLQMLGFRPCSSCVAD